jgi:hypothetical protein
VFGFALPLCSGEFLELVFGHRLEHFLRGAFQRADLLLAALSRKRRSRRLLLSLGFCRHRYVPPDFPVDEANSREPPWFSGIGVAVRDAPVALLVVTVFFDRLAESIVIPRAWPETNSTFPKSYYFFVSKELLFRRHSRESRNPRASDATDV